MARYNQFAGRRPEAWHERYKSRLEIAQAQIEALRTVGEEISDISTFPIGGPGVPGHNKAGIVAFYKGKKLGRKGIRKLCVARGIKLDAHSLPLSS